jgi:spore germination protein GerM
VLVSLDFLSRIHLGRRALIAGSALVAVLLVSLFFFFLVGYKREKRVLFFPREGSAALAAEERFLPNHRDLEVDLRKLIEEVILGPAGHDEVRLIPREVTVRSLSVQNHVLYLDLSADIVTAGHEYPLHGDEALEALKKTILFNFPKVREVAVTVDGQVPRFGEKKKIR